MALSDVDATIRLLRETSVTSEKSIHVISQLLSNQLSDDLIATILLGKEDDIAVTFIKALQSTQDAAIIGFLARFLADACQVVPSLAMAVAQVPHAADTFFSISRVHAGTPNATNPAVFLFATALRYAGRPDPTAVDRCITGFVNAFAATALHAADVEFTVHALSMFAKRREFRPLLQRAEIPTHVLRVIVEACSEVSAGVVQLTYETLRVIWMLTYDYSCLIAMTKAKMLPTIHRVLQRSTKEKCIRMCLMIFCNVCAIQRRYFKAQQSGDQLDLDLYMLGAISSRGPTFCSDLAGLGVNKTLGQLARRKFGDDDISAMIEELTQYIDATLEASSSFSEYRGEVQSGNLEWTPVHTNPKFWKENAIKFDENGFEVLKDLTSIVITSKNELTLAVACSDVGELVRHHPSGRLLLDLPQAAGLKERILALMSHSNAEVAKNALLAVQKIMVQRWEYIR